MRNEIITRAGEEDIFKAEQQHPTMGQFKGLSEQGALSGKELEYRKKSRYVEAEMGSRPKNQTCDCC